MKAVLKQFIACSAACTHLDASPVEASSPYATRMIVVPMVLCGFGRSVSRILWGEGRREYYALPAVVAKVLRTLEETQEVAGGAVRIVSG